MSIFCCCSGCEYHGEGRCTLFVEDWWEGMTSGAIVNARGLVCEGCYDARRKGLSDQ